MWHVRSLPIALAAVSALCGCTIVGSHRLAPDAGLGSGVAYALPMSRVPVVLSTHQGQIVLRLLTPRVVADPDHRYVAQRQSNAFGSDQVTIGVDPATGFLTSVSAVGKDDTLAVLETLLLPKPAAKAESFESGDELFRAEIDPTNDLELEQVAKSLNESLKAFLDQHGVPACTLARPVCDEYAALRVLAPKITLQGRPATRSAAGAGSAASAAATSASTPVAHCGIGICYRQPQPYMLTLGLGGVSRSLVLQIPNAAPLVAVPLERHAFVTTSHTLTFEQGTLKSATVDRPSSALALVSSPLAAVSGVIGSITKPLSELLKIDTSGQYEAQATQAKAQADTARAQADEAKAQAGETPVPDPNAALATLTIGTSRPTAGLGGASALQPAAASAAGRSQPSLSTSGSSGSGRH